MENVIRVFWSQIPRLFRFILISVVLLTAFMVLLRIAFWIIFKDPLSSLSFHDFYKAMWLGFRFDLRIAMVTFFVLYLLGGFKWLSPFTSKWHRYVWIAYLTSFFIFIIFFYTIDFAHYDYLGLRVNFNALHLLENLSISARMVWESYPVIPIVTLLLFVTIIFIYLLNRLLKYFTKQSASLFKWWVGFFSFLISLILLITFQTKKFPKFAFSWSKTTVRFWKASTIGIVSFLVVFIFIQSKFSQYPLRWSDATFSNSPFSTQLAYNPIHYFFDTWKNGRVTYDINKSRAYYDIVADYLKVHSKNRDTLNFNRVVYPTHTLGKTPNIVIIVVESFASYKTSMSGNFLNPTPNVNTIANNGYYFKNFFTPSTGTARSIWTLITGIADTESKGTSSRNPLVVDQHSVANEFKGYKKFYFIGGSASWGNIRGILNKNIDNLHLIEKGDYRFSDVDVWGISDLNLLIEANDIFKKETKPFFAIIQTAGNHRPYTIPDDNYGFKLAKNIDKITLDKNGFNSLRELNAYRFMDHSIGHYIKLLKKENYSKNTIFVFFGDHGINGNPEHVAKEDKISTLALGSLRVPFIIWSPNLIKKPKIFKTVASEMDVLPTLAALSGLSYVETTFGRDLFNPIYDDSRYAFTVQQNEQPQLGLVSDKFYYQMFKDQPGKLHKLYTNDPLKDHKLSYPKIARKMRDLTIGLYETMRYKAHFNQNSKAKLSPHQ